MIPKVVPFGKVNLELLALPAIVILVGLSAFGLGRLSVLDGQNKEDGRVQIYQGNGLASTTSNK